VRSRQPLWARVLDKTAESRRWRIGVLTVATFVTVVFVVVALLTIHGKTGHVGWDY
jgi:hypothetical protein